jgi:ABC-type sugar transport system ATPase subunit
MEEQVQSARATVSDDICLTATNVTKIYPGTVALNNVDFTIYRGKVNVLIGENGAGKSTLMKVLAGIEQPNEGRIFLNGKEIHLENTRDAAAIGIGIIHQELNLFFNLNVAQNIFMAHEIVNYGIQIDQKTQAEKSKVLMEHLEAFIDPETSVGDLRVGQQQIVEIAKTMALQNLHVLIMDEPTSSLSAPEVEVLFRIIKELKEQGVSIVYISHRLEEIMRIGDHITILRDGNKVAEGDVSKIDIPWIIKNMVGRETLKIVKNHQVKKDEELLRAEAITLPRVGGGYSLENVSFSLRRGEVLGIYGLMGAGRTELIETLMGLRQEATGKVFLEGKPCQLESVSEQIELGFAHVPEDRQRDGLIAMLSIDLNLTLASLKNYLKGLKVSNSLKDKAIKSIIDDLGIKVANPKLSVNSLSGGNQQKVVIGKGILTQPKVLLLDEPTRGIDVGAKLDVFEIVDRMAAKGLGVIFVASELKEIIAVSDRVLVMSNGKVTGDFEGAAITEEALVAASAVGHGTGKKTENAS